MTAAIQFFGQQLPVDFAQTLREVRSGQPERLSRLLRDANDAGWTLTALAEPLGVTREAVRLRIKRADHPRHLAAPNVEIPSPPTRAKTKAEIQREASAERARNRELRPCGTRSAYARHIYRGEEPDDACRQAANDYNGEERRIYARSWQRAVTKLKRRYPDLFQALYAAELRRERDSLDKAARARAWQRALGALTRECPPKDWEPLFAAEMDREQRRAVAS